MAHYDTFRVQLATTHPAFGHALWEPDPGEQYPAVEVGDVGFIRQGKFHRLFNALFSEIHPSNQRFGVPGDHELLPPVPNHIDHGTLYPNNFCSYGVNVTSGRSQVLSVEPVAPGSVDVSFSCRSKHGAVLSLPVAARREDTLAQDQFRRWIIQHIDSWFTFSQQRGLGIEMEDIVLVTGFHRTRSWSNIAFYENQMHAQVSFGFQVPNILGTTVNWQVSGQDIQGAVLSHGPSGENLPENQCIFVRGFRVKRTLKIFPRVRGAAEPIPDPSGNDDEPETEIVSIPSTEYEDPLHALLEYIGEQEPHCDLVLVHDDDLERILRVGDGTSFDTLQPAEVMSYFRRLKLDVEVAVIPGAHMKEPSPTNDESSKTDTKHRTVAMLSEQLQNDGIDQPGRSTMRDYLSSDFSPASSFVLSPATSGRHLSRLTVGSERVLPRESFTASPVSPQTSRSGWDKGIDIVTSPPFETLADMNTAPSLPKSRPRGFTDDGPSTVYGRGYSTSDQKLSSESPLYNLGASRVVVRQPSSTRIHSLRPPTAPLDVELPLAPESARRAEFSLLPPFPEPASPSSASSSSSLSFASSILSKSYTMVPEGQRREVRRLKDSERTTNSRPCSPSKDRSRDVRDSPSKLSTFRSEFSPTRTLKKAISVHNLPKRPQENFVPSPTPPTAEDTTPIKKQRSFHHTHILTPHFPTTLKQANSPGRDGLPVPDDYRNSAQSSPKGLITLPVSNQKRVRERLFSGSGSRRHASPQSRGPDDERQSILSSPSATSPHTRSHTAIAVNRSSVSNRPELSSFWDEEL